MSELFVLKIILLLLLIAILVRFRTRDPSLYRPLKSALIFFAILYGGIVSSVVIYEFYLDYRLDLFDLDGDGIFSVVEQTPEQQEAMNEVIWDTGRTFAPIIGFIFSAGLSFMFYLLSKILSYVWKHT